MLERMGYQQGCLLPWVYLRDSLCKTGIEINEFKLFGFTISKTQCVPKAFPWLVGPRPGPLHCSVLTLTPPLVTAAGPVPQTRHKQKPQIKIKIFQTIQPDTNPHMLVSVSGSRARWAPAPSHSNAHG